MKTALTDALPKEQRQSVFHVPAKKQGLSISEDTHYASMEKSGARQTSVHIEHRKESGTAEDT